LIEQTLKKNNNNQGLEKIHGTFGAINSDHPVTWKKNAEWCSSSEEKWFCEQTRNVSRELQEAWSVKQATLRNVSHGD